MMMNSNQKNYQAPFKLGEYVFNKKFEEQIYPNLSPSFIASLQSTTIAEKYGWQWAQVLPEMLETSDKYVQPQFENQQLFNILPPILPLMAVISFTRVKRLDLSHIHITTIETLPFMSIPTIESLVLDDNMITGSTKAFNKLALKQLNILSISENKINQVQLSRCKLNKQLIILCTDYRGIVQLQDQKLLMKMDVKTIERLIVSKDQEMIKMNRISHQLFLRFSQGARIKSTRLAYSQ